MVERKPKMAWAAESVAHAQMRAVFALVRTPALRSHECERGTHECVRHRGR